MSSSPFNGFPNEAILFFVELSANNNKTWFAEHKPEFEKFVMTPARDFVVAMGERLQELSPGITADPRVNKSIFRIYRDIRFSKDKTPYKTNLGLWFWVGGGAKVENPGYYFHLDAENLMVGVGSHSFSKPQLKAYRDAVVDPELGPALTKVVSDLVGKGYGIGQKTYKRAPRGYDPDHQYADLLLYSGLTSGIDLGIPSELHSPALLELCFQRYRDMAPMVYWLQEMKTA